MRRTNQFYLQILIALALLLSSMPINLLQAESVLFEQSFEGNDGDQPADWRVTAGTGALLANQYAMTTSNDTFVQYYPLQYPEWKDVKVAVDVKLDSAGAMSGPAMRVNSSANSYYYVRLQAGTPGKLEILKVINGTTTVLKTMSAGDISTMGWYTLESYIFANSIKAVLKPQGDSRIIGVAVVDDNSITDTGSIALKGRFGNSKFDHLSVEPITSIPGQMTILNESFTGSNGEQPANWSQKAGVIHIQDGTYTAATGADSFGQYQPTLYPYMKNSEMQADITLTASTATSGLMFRADASSSSYYYSRISYGDPGKLEIVKVKNGTSVIKSVDVKISLNVAYTLKTFVVENQIKAYVVNRDVPDAILAVLDVEDDSITTAGSWGLKARFGNTKFDNYSVKELNAIPGNIPLLNESFNGINGMQPPGWRNLTGSMNIQSNEYASGTGSDAAAQYFPAAMPLWYNVQIQADVKLSAVSASSGPAVRMNSSGNTYYYARISAGAPGKLEIVKVVSGTATVLKTSDVKIVQNEWYTLSFFAVGSQLKAQVYKRDNYPSVIGSAAVTDSSITSQGTIGLKARFGNSVFDRVSAASMEIMPESILLDEFNGINGWTTQLDSGTGTLNLAYDPSTKLYGASSLNLKLNNTTPIVGGVRNQIALPAGTQRVGVSIYTRGVSVTGMNMQIRDSTGETFKYPITNASDTAWDQKEITIAKLWDSSRHSGGNNDGVPDFPLVFEGINYAIGAGSDLNIYMEDLTAYTYGKDMHPQSVFRVKDVDDTIRYQGSYAGFKTQYYDDNQWPYLTLGSILPSTAGSYQIAYRIEREGKIVNWGSKTVASYVPAQQEREKIYVELEEEGAYWVYVKVKDSAGNLLEIKQPFIVQVTHGLAPTAVTDQSASFYATKLDLLRLNPHKTEDTYAYNEPVVLKMRIYKPAQAYTTLSYAYTIVDYADETARQTGTEVFSFGSNNQFDKDITFVPPRKGAYYMTMSLYGDGVLIDQKKQIFGMKPSPYDADFFNENNVLPYETLLEQKTDVYNMSGVFSLGVTHSTYFNSFVDKAAEAGSTMNMIVYWDQLEPMKGVYEFDYLADRIGYAKSKGVKLIFGVWTHLDHLPTWLWYDEMLDQNYRINQYSATYLHNYTRSSERNREAYKSMLENVIKKYRNDLSIIGWNFSDGVESFYSDSPGSVAIADYSRSARDEFIAYLQTVKGLTLAQLNSRYGTNFSAWDEVELPKPDWEAKPDLRKIWVDFYQFKQYRIKSWFDEYMAYLRQFDNERAVYQYASTGTGAFEDSIHNFNSNKMIMTSGGSDHVLDQLYEAYGSKLNVPLRSEPAGTPPKISQVNDSFYNIATYGSFEGLNLQFVRRWQEVVERNDQSVYEAVYQFQTVKDLIIQDHFNDSKVIESKLGVFNSFDSMIFNSKSFRWLDWGANVGEILYYFNDYEHFYPSWISDYTASSWLSTDKHSVVLDTGSTIMKQQVSDNLVNYVNHGGKLILFADTGKYNLDTGNADRRLLTELGFQADSWGNKGTGVTANVYAGNGVFDGITQLKLNNQYYIQPQMDVPYEVIAAYSNGKPAAIKWNYGSGQVVLILGTLDWYNSKGFIDSLQTWGGFKRYSDSGSDKVRVVSRTLNSEQVVFAYYRPWFSTANKSQADIDASDYPPVTTNIKVAELTAASYNVYDAASGGTLIGTYTNAQLSGGISLIFNPGELKILRLVPVVP